MQGGCIVKVVKEPELRFTTEGKPWLKARSGIESRVKNPDGEWVTELVWCDLFVNGRLAERAADHIKKGTRLVVIGKLQANNWTNKEGEKVEGLTLRADSIGLDLTFGLDDDNNVSQASSSRPAPSSKPAYDYSEEPF